jgi:GTP-binding protein
LAFASKTPGRTQHINYFSIGGAHVGQHRKDATIVDEIEALLVDLPGYGYAEVSGSAKLHWQKLLGDYVQRREQLAALVLIMDSRRPFTELDVQMLEWFAPTGKPIHCILTKADKLNRNESTNALRQARMMLDSYVDEDGEGFPFTVQLFSALKRIGIEEANDKIIDLLGLTPVEPTRTRCWSTRSTATTKPFFNHADESSLPRHPPAPHAQRPVLARADARKHDHRRPT